MRCCVIPLTWPSCYLFSKASPKYVGPVAFPRETKFEIGVQEENSGELPVQISPAQIVKPPLISSDFVQSKVESGSPFLSWNRDLKIGNLSQIIGTEMGRVWGSESATSSFSILCGNLFETIFELWMKGAERYPPIKVLDHWNRCRNHLFSPFLNNGMCDIT